jgi:hypothetical protein
MPALFGGFMASVWESFLSAAQTLVVAGSVKQRLADAYSQHLAHIANEDLPREIRDEFAALEGSMSAISPLRGESAIQATVRKMSDSQAATCALQIINLFASLAKLQLQTRTPMLRAVNSGDD